MNIFILEKTEIIYHANVCNLYTDLRGIRYIMKYYFDLFPLGIFLFGKIALHTLTNGFCCSKIK